MRDRSTITGSLTANSHWWRKYTPPANTTPEVSVQSFSGTQTLKSISDVPTPGFHALRKCGKFLPLNPVVITNMTEKRTPQSGYYRPSGGPFEWRGEHYGPATMTLAIPPWDDDVVTQVVNSAAANAAQGEFDYLTFLAEFGKSVNYMGGVVRRFNGVTANLAKQARRFRKEPWAAFRELWLEARYSVRPLIYDTRSILSSVRKLGDELEMIKGSASRTENGDDSFDSGWVVIDPSHYERRVIETLECTYKYRARSYLEFRSKMNRSFHADPLQTAWELVPYSFVVDWFVDIGSYLSTLRPRLQGDFLGHQFSVQRTSKLVQTVNWQGRNGSVYSVTPTTTEIETEQYTRGPASPGLPPVLPELTLPRVIDLAALVFKGRRDVNQILNRRS